MIFVCSLFNSLTDFERVNSKLFEVFFFAVAAAATVIVFVCRMYVYIFVVAENELSLPLCACESLIYGVRISLCPPKDIRISKMATTSASWCLQRALRHGLCLRREFKSNVTVSQTFSERCNPFNFMLLFYNQNSCR